MMTGILTSQFVADIVLIGLSQRCHGPVKFYTHGRVPVRLDGAHDELTNKSSDTHLTTRTCLITTFALTTIHKVIICCRLTWSNSGMTALSPPRYLGLAIEGWNEFITVSHPAQGASNNLKRRAHSHAARVAHARARRHRVAEYMNEKDTVEQKAQREATNHGSQNQTQTRDVLCHQCNLGLVGRDKTTFLAKRAISDAFEHEPFARFMESLSPREHFMLNHCESVHSVL